jgi:outer membrane lipoprotein-sorting protein
MKLLATIVALGAAVSVQAQTPDAIMKRAASAYTEMKTIRAEFEQTITNPLTGTNATARGVMLRRAPDLLSVTFTSPKGDRVVADGKSRRWEGFLLVSVYGLAVVWYLLA